MKYLVANKESKTRLLRWILLLQEFDLEVWDKKGCENTIAEHLSRMFPVEETEEKRHIKDEFADEYILVITGIPWFAHYVNYFVGGVIPDDFDYNKKKKFLQDCRLYCGMTHSCTKRG